MQRPWLFSSLLMVTLSACNAPTSTPSSKQETPSSTPAKEKEAGPQMKEPSAFVPSGMETVDIVRGDLAGDGLQGAVLITASHTPTDAKLGEGSPRTVLILRSDSSGNLKEMERNEKIVPCQNCGGLAGDPYGYARIDKGSFIIATSGGSRERWANEYTFAFEQQHSTWQLQKAVRTLADTTTEQINRIELTPDDFGVISFSNFDPKALPTPPPLPEEKNEDASQEN